MKFHEAVFILSLFSKCIFMLVEINSHCASDIENTVLEVYVIFLKVVYFIFRKVPGMQCINVYKYVLVYCWCFPPPF